MVAMAQRRYPRTARLDEVVLEVLASELERLDDPRLDMVTLTGVDVSNDLSHATVWFTARSEGERDRAEAALVAAAPRLRGVVGRSVRMKQTPRLDFRADPAIEAGARVEQVLREGGRRHDAVEDR
jgi:ribosome-binding factor A